MLDKGSTIVLVEIVLRPAEQKGFVVQPKRWIVERTFGWFNHYRVLSKDDEVYADTSAPLWRAYMSCQWISYRNIDPSGSSYTNL